MVLGAHDAKNFYAAVVDSVQRKAHLLRISNGRRVSLAEASVHLKPVEWHSLRVQRNTIISKDFIEVYVDGALVLSVEDQTLGLGRVGLVLVGKSSMFFDSFHAVPLFLIARSRPRRPTKFKPGSSHACLFWQSGVASPCRFAKGLARPALRVTRPGRMLFWARPGI